MNGRKKFSSSLFREICFSLLFKRPELVQIMRSIGNKLANSVWEANIKNRVKLQPNASSYVLIDYLFNFRIWYF
jgi:hypothetical protein